MFRINVVFLNCIIQHFHVASFSIYIRPFVSSLKNNWCEYIFDFRTTEVRVYSRDRGTIPGDDAHSRNRFVSYWLLLLILY